MAKKKRKSRRKKRKNPIRRCGICRSAKHDRRKCKKRSKKSKKIRRRRRNPGVADSLAEMGLSYAYSKPRHNPCVTCGCTCKDTAAGASRFLRSRLHRSRRNPGWSFKKDRVIPHEQQLDEMYPIPRPRLRRRNPEICDICNTIHGSWCPLKPRPSRYFR